MPNKKLSGLFGSLLFATVAAAAAPDLIPRDLLFGNPERTSPQISPDGRQLAWLAPDKSGVLNVWIRTLNKNDERPMSNESHRPIPWFSWSPDGKRLLYLQDNAGNEIDHLFAVDLVEGKVRDLTPYSGVRAQNVITDLQHPDSILVALNLRDRQLFDMHRIDLATGKTTLEATNNGDVLTWATDNDFVIRGATAFDGKTQSTIIRVRDSVDKPWRDLVVMPFERALFPGEVVEGSLIAGFDPDGKSLIIHSALHSDKGRLVRVNLGNGEETSVIAEDAESDIADGLPGVRPSVMINPITHSIEAVEFEYATRHWVFLDPKVKEDFEKITRSSPGFPELISRDRGNRQWVVAIHRSDAPDSYYSYDRNNEHVAFLFDEHPALKKFRLLSKKPIVIKARDGLPLLSYLTSPGEAKKAPLVLSIHGGPWYRDRNVYDSEVQFLANRGYAVLQVNYRGSTGFGIQFLNAGTNQWGRGTQQDLYDAVQWTIDNEIADPKRIAAMGWSGGGFATLRSLEMRPDLFACGVDGVGPADLAPLFRNFPSYWANIMPRWRRRAGDMDHDETLNRSVSPLYHIDSIRAPLLIIQGQNDPRVPIANADAMVAALRKAKREVNYVVYTDEGHGPQRPENQIDLYGRVEEFLGRKLGGRVEPWRKVAGANVEVR